MHRSGPASEDPEMPSPSQQQKGHSLSDVDIDKLLASSSSDSEPEDDGRILPTRKRPNPDRPKVGGGGGGKREKRSAKATWTEPPWHTGDIVWRLQMMTPLHTHKVAVRDSDLVKTCEEFEARGEELRGDLFVVESFATSLTRMTVMLLPVFDGRSARRPLAALKPVKTEFSHVHLYKRDYTTNHAIMGGIFRSIARKMHDPAYHAYKSGLEKQHENVIDFINLQSEFPEIDPQKYLVMDKEDRDEYLRRWKPNACWGDLTLNLEGTDDEQQDSDEGLIVEDQMEALALSPEPPPVPEEPENAPSSEGSWERSSQLIQWFKRRAVQAHLVKVMSGKVKSERHDMLTRERRPDLGINSRLLRLSNATYIDDDGENGIRVVRHRPKCGDRTQLSRLKDTQGCQGISGFRPKLY
ncbi:unnamed protein product [Sphagnum tenellum]